jgi:hypothetical protein
MDVATDVIPSIPHANPENSLSYDDTVAYEQQVPTATEADPRSNLASRIGNTKIYLLSEATAAARSAKVCPTPLSTWQSECETDQRFSAFLVPWLGGWSRVPFSKPAAQMVTLPLVVMVVVVLSANTTMIRRKFTLTARNAAKSLAGEKK